LSISFGDEAWMQTEGNGLFGRRSHRSVCSKNA